MLSIYIRVFRNYTKLALLARKVYIGDQWRIQGVIGKNFAKIIGWRTAWESLRLPLRGNPGSTPGAAKIFQQKRRRNTATED